MSEKKRTRLSCIGTLPVKYKKKFCSIAIGCRLTEECQCIKRNTICLKWRDDFSYEFLKNTLQKVDLDTKFKICEKAIHCPWKEKDPGLNCYKTDPDDAHYCSQWFTMDLSFLGKTITSSAGLEQTVVRKEKIKLDEIDELIWGIADRWNIKTIK